MNQAVGTVFVLANGKLCKVTESALSIMLNHRQISSTSREAGGILLGRIIAESGHVVIDEVTEPMETDKRSRYSFYRLPKGHQEYYFQRWHESNGTCFYLGEWHTHPEKTPNPSSIDRRGWVKIINDHTELDVFLFIIVGQEEIRVWQGENKGATLNRLLRLGETLE